MSAPQTFWARRRAAVEAEEAAARLASEAELSATHQAALEQRSDEEILAELDLPVPETLGPGDDFSAFMAKAVPEYLRRRALRTLWRSNPVLANVDMLVDYGEDFTDSATVVENLQTAYQVGKGMLKHVEEMVRQAAERDALESAEPAAAEAEAGEDQPDLQDDMELMAEAEEAAPTPAAVESACLAEEPETTPAPRRMTFRIEETA